MINIATDLIYEGFATIPLKNNKSPMLPPGHNYLYELIKESDIDKLFMKAEKIGVVCGQVSSGFECIDFDAHKAEPIGDIFNKFMSDAGVSTIIDVNSLPIVKTPSGGFHIYYKCEAIESGRVLAKWKTGDVMIEKRGHGQYVATIPSEGYKLIRGSEIVKTATISFDERDYLLAIAEKFSEVDFDTTNKQNGKWPDKFDTSTAWGKFNEEGYNEATEILESIGWKLARVRKHDNVELWTRPGKDYQNENSMPVSATLGKYHNMFYNWSSSSEYFEPEKGYTFFDILIMVKFKGNKKEAIKYLEKKYNIIHYKPSYNKNSKEFPVNTLPDFVKDFIINSETQNNFDVKVTASTFLWVVSVLIGNKIRLQINNSWKTSPVIWFMIIAERGSSKTHAVNTMISKVKKLDIESKKRFDEELKYYNPDDKSAKHPIFKQMLLEDGTREGYVKAMQHNPGGLGLVKDELNGWLSDMDKHSGSKGGDEAFWISSFNNTSYLKNIKSENATVVERMFIGLIGSVQPHIMENFSKNHSENGMFDRFLMIPYEEKPFKFKLFNENQNSLKFNYDNFLEQLYKSLQTIEDVQNIRFSEDGEIEFENKYNDLLAIKYKTDNPNIRAYISKIITYLPRFSLVFEVISSGVEWSKGNCLLMVSKDSILKAYDVLKFYLANAEDVLFDINKNTDVQDIIKGSGAVKRSDKARALIEAMINGEVNISQMEIARKLNMKKQQVNYLYKQISGKQSK